MSGVHCHECGVELPDEPRDLLAEAREPCPNCGSTERAYAVYLQATAAAETSVSLDLALAAANTVQTRVQHLREELDRLEALISSASRDPAQMHRVVSNMLDVLDELNDAGYQRQEWGPPEWPEDTIDLWHGLICARNVAHHNRAYIVVLHGTGEPDQHLCWNAQQDGLRKVRSPIQREGYERQLHGRAVLPQLREITALLEHAIEA